jgi:hypothetical protein
MLARHLRWSKVLLLDEPLEERLCHALYPQNLRSRWTRSTTSPTMRDKWSRDNALGYQMLFFPQYFLPKVWSTTYCSEVVGSSTKPSFVAIILDIIDLVKFVNRYVADFPGRTLEACFVKFALQHYRQMRSVTITDYTEEISSSMKEYLTDLFATVSGIRGADYSLEGRPLLWKQPLLHCSLPGPTPLFVLHGPIYSDSSESSTSLTDLKASFIQAGPFKIHKTHKYHQHLTLTHDNELFVYNDPLLYEDPLELREDIRLESIRSQVSIMRRDGTAMLDAYDGHVFAKYHNSSD